MTPHHPLIAADRVNGTDVYNASGDKLGKIEDVAIEKVSGEVAYAILSFGGFLGVGSRFHPVPWKLLSYDVEKGGYIIPCSQAQLESAPSIDEQELSGWNDAAAREDIYTYYGISPYWP